MSTWVFDVDGTVCWSGQEMTEEMAEILAAQEHRLVFLSGTDGPELERMLRPLWERQPYIDILPNSGCTEELHNKPEVLEALKDIITLYELPNHSGKDDQILDRGTQVTLSCIGRGAPKLEKSAFDYDGEIRKGIIRSLHMRLGFFTYSINQGGTTSIDITPYGWDKARGLQEYMDHRGIKPMDVLYFGDRFDEGGNDACLLGIVPCMKVLNPEHLLHVLRGR